MIGEEHVKAINLLPPIHATKGLLIHQWLPIFGITVNAHHTTIYFMPKRKSLMLKEETSMNCIYHFARH
jgi:hypothetical protein